MLVVNIVEAVDVVLVDGAGESESVPDDIVNVKTGSGVMV